jgi:hypothetical protein
MKNLNIFNKILSIFFCLGFKTLFSRILDSKVSKLMIFEFGFIIFLIYAINISFNPFLNHNDPFMLGFFSIKKPSLSSSLDYS